jgi:hypothetical protein
VANRPVNAQEIPAHGTDHTTNGAGGKETDWCILSSLRASPVSFDGQFATTDTFNDSYESGKPSRSEQ